MEIKYIFKKLKKLKYLIVISLIVVFILSYCAALTFNPVKYRSIGEINYFIFSKQLAKEVSSEFYYFYIRGYKSNTSNEQTETRYLMNYYDLEIVHKKVYEYVLSQGYDLDFETFEKGITSFFRSDTYRKRITVTFEDKNLSIITLEKLFELAPKIYNDTMTNRIKIELEYRENNEIEIVNEINEMKTQIQILTEDEYSELLDTHLNTLESHYDENYEYIIKLRTIVGFDFASLFKKYEQTLENGVMIGNMAIEIGMIGVLTVIIAWMLYFYTCYIKEKLKRCKGVK